MFAGVPGNWWCWQCGSGDAHTLRYWASTTLRLRHCGACQYEQTFFQARSGTDQKIILSHSDLFSHKPAVLPYA